MSWPTLKSSEISKLAPSDAAAFVFLIEHRAPGLLRGHSVNIASRIIGSIVRGASLSKDAFGKPIVVGGPLSISISHSGSCLVVALAKVRVGVDIEFLRYRHRWLTLYHWITAPEERFREPTEIDFLESWTAKESVVKIFGRTVDQGIQSVSVPAVRSTAFRRASVSGKRFWIKPLPRWNEMVGFLALAEPLVVQRYFLTDYTDWRPE